MTKEKTFDDILHAWAAEMPEDMRGENAHDKLLDSFLRLFENLSAAKIKSFPRSKHLLCAIRRAMQWQWTLLDIALPPLFSQFAPHALSLMIIRWLTIWRGGKTPGNQRLMAAIDRDLQRLDAAAQYLLRR